MCMAYFYMVIMKAVLLYNKDSFIVSEKNIREHKSFHDRAIRYTAGHYIDKWEEVWEYPYHKQLLKERKLLPIEKYFKRRREHWGNTLKMERI